MAKNKLPGPFSADGRLYDLEIAFIEAVEKGETFSPAENPAKSELSIRAGLIRAMLIGTPLKHHPARAALSGPRPVRMTPHGIRIVPARSACKTGEPRLGAGAPLLRIVDALDLEGLAAPDGAPLTPLHFERCIFEQPLCLMAAHIKSLTLKETRFSLLDARDARINGSLVIEGCRPRNDPVDPGERHFASHTLAVRKDGSHAEVSSGSLAEPASGGPCACPLCTLADEEDTRNCGLCCVINLRAAVIDGGVDIVGSYLRGARLVGRDYRTPALWDCVAAQFYGAQVRGRFNVDRSTFVGRISLISAEIGGDVWFSGGKVVASAERPSINFQLARIGGLVAFEAARATEEEEGQGIRAFPAIVIGQISAINIAAAEIWIGEGFYFAHDSEKRGAFSTLNFAKAEIRGSFKVGCYHDYHVLDPACPTGVARMHGEICLEAATIGKNLMIHGAYYDGIVEALGLANPFFDSFGVDRAEPSYLKLTGHGLTVDRRIYISHGRFRDAGGCRPGTHGSPAPSRSRNPQTAAIDLWKSTIGIGFRIGEHSGCIGAIRLNSCVIGREVTIACRLIEPSPQDRAGEGIEAGRIPHLIDISESTIKGHLRIGRHQERSKAAAALASELETLVTVKGAVTLESASVQGGILLGHVTFDLEAFALPEPPAGQCGGTVQGSAMEENRIALNLRDCVCGAELDIHSLRWQLPPLAQGETCAIEDLPRGLDRLRLARQERRFRSIARGSFALVDLRGLQCGLLVDGFGAEWGLVYRLRLRLAGIKIGEVEPASHKAPHSPTKRPAGTRLRWLAHQNCKQRVVDEAAAAAAAGPRSDGHGAREPAPLSLLERYCCARNEDFVPQAYDAFSSAYRRAGENPTAEHILIEKKNIENALRFRRLKARWVRSLWRWPALAAQILLIAALALSVGLEQLPRPLDSIAIGAMIVATIGLLWPYLVSIGQMIFRFGFRYGLSVQSAMFVFTLLILLGMGGVYWARNGGWAPISNWAKVAPNGVLDSSIVLVLDVEHEPLQLGSSAASLRDGGMRREGEAIHARPSPCNLDVNSLLYAVDVFIPLIDLDQERRCKVRDALPGSVVDEYAWWRIFKALYELVGWIVTSLVILTLTGVLRRDLER